MTMRRCAAARRIAVASKGFDANDVARRWVKWIRWTAAGSDHDQACAHIDRPREGPFEAGQLASQRIRALGRNGSVMRCIPVALRYHDDPDRLIRVSTQQAAITHADERCTGCGAVNLAARELLHGNIYFMTSDARIGDRAPRALREAIHRVPREARRSRSREPVRRLRVHCVKSRSGS